MHKFLGDLSHVPKKEGLIELNLNPIQYPSLDRGQDLTQGIRKTIERNQGDLGPGQGPPKMPTGI